MLGWPCGTSLRIGGATFHKWQLPVRATEKSGAAAAAERQQELPSMGGSTPPEGAAVEPYIRIEEAAVEHQLDCVSEDAALDGGGTAGGGGEREREDEREL